MENCLFCEWKDEKEKIILENEYAFARFDEFPVSKGHILFMTKRHVKDFFETTAEEKNAIFELMDQAKAMLDEKYYPDGYNIGMNCGQAAGQSVMHVHVHLIPRYNGDSVGITWTPGTLTDEAKEEILEKVKAQFS